MIDITTKVNKVWNWRKFSFIEKRSFEVVKTKRVLEWDDPTYGNGGGDFIQVERKTILKVFEEFEDALEYKQKIEEILTAEEFLKESDNAFYKTDLIEFAKYHVEQALKQASKNVKTYDVYNESTGDTECKVTFVDVNSILNAYPLDLIV